MKWPLFSDWAALIIILVIMVFVWPIVGCDRVVTSKSPQAPSPTPVEISTAPPVATATLHSRECPFGQAITGCDN
jgi:hypothetical protein